MGELYRCILHGCAQRPKAVSDEWLACVKTMFQGITCMDPSTSCAHPRDNEPLGYYLLLLVPSGPSALTGCGARICMSGTGEMEGCGAFCCRDLGRGCQTWP